MKSWRFMTSMIMNNTLEENKRMKCVILAAGYATRLYPLTENFPKPLLKVKDKTIIDWIISDLDAYGLISEFIIVSNHKFITIFEDWKKDCSYQAKITVLDDGTVDNEHRLGAVKDIAFAIEQCNIKEDLMVVAGDNLTDFSLKGFVDYFMDKNASCVMRHFEDDFNKLRKTGVIMIDDAGKILEMQEKPAEPKSNWAVPPFYIYKKEDLEKIVTAVKDEVCNTDAPGDFIAWMCSQGDVYAYEMPGKRYDIGSLESYERIQHEYMCERV